MTIQADENTILLWEGGRRTPDICPKCKVEIVERTHRAGIRRTTRWTCGCPRRMRWALVKSTADPLTYAPDPVPYVALRRII